MSSAIIKGPNGIARCLIFCGASVLDNGSTSSFAYPRLEFLHASGTRTAATPACQTGR